MFLPHNMAAVKPLYNLCAYMCKSFLHQKKYFSEIVVLSMVLSSWKTCTKNELFVCINQLRI